MSTSSLRRGGLLIGALAFLFLAGPSARAQDRPLSLDEAIRTALSANERALRADQGLAAAEAQVTKARAYFMPALSVAGTYTRRPFEVVRAVGGQQVVIQNYNGLAGSANLSMILFDSHSLPALKQSAYNREAARYTSTDSKRLLAFDVGNAFLSALGVEQVLEASLRRRDFAQQSLAAAKARFAAGLVSGNDVTRAELEYATADIGIVQSQGGVESAYLALGHLLNTPAPKALETPGFLLQAEEGVLPPAEQLIAEAQARRPDVNALRWQSKSQQALVLEPLLKWLPTLALTGRYTYTNEAGLTGRNFNWNAGLSLNWSIFDGLTRNGEYAERKALSSQVGLDLQAALRGVDLAVRDALVVLNSQRGALKLAAVASGVARKNAEETAALYRQGLSSALQVADANVRLFEAEVDLARARFGVGIAYLNLESALGLDPLGKEPRFDE